MPNNWGPEDLTVAMITMNEAAAVGKVIDDIKAVVPNAEILVVDSSKDDTPQIAEKKGARVIRQFPPQGYGKAMHLALTSGRGKVVVTLDCDDTYPAEDIPKLASLVADAGFDVVDGCRIQGKPDAMPWLNYAANMGFATIASVMFWYPIKDLHSGMRAYRRSLFDEISFAPKGAALPVELLLRPLRMGKRVVAVPIAYRERVGTSTMRPVRRTSSPSLSFV